MVAFCLFLLFVLVFLVDSFFFVSYVSVSGDDVLYWLHFCTLTSVCFFLFFFSEIVPGLIWFGSVDLVTTAGFVADQLM